MSDFISQRLPGSISRLDELAHNIWWSWNEEARRLFRMLDYTLWNMSVHNPVKLLRETSKENLLTAASDPAFLTQYDKVMEQFDAETTSQANWLHRQDGSVEHGPVAYFSMEFAVHNSLPIYAGGLGILAGDICKEASDMALPLVGIGFMYPQGYFHQHIKGDGWQEEEYQQLDFEKSPISRVHTSDGKELLVELELDGEKVSIGLWQLSVGRTQVYLMDTNQDSNPGRFRDLSARLYVADNEQRLRQEIVLGIGGVRVMRALGIEPSIWHANEGHSAFMMLERVREKVAGGLSFAVALKAVKKNTVFTTHTPVMAGHDIFPPQLMERYFGSYLKQFGVSIETLLGLGRRDGSTAEPFNMTIFALGMSDQRSAVSQLHGAVTKKMWHGLWKDISEEAVPITAVTNGVHFPSWIAPELFYLLEGYLGEGWLENYDNPEIWERILAIPNAELWSIHQLLKRKLLRTMREGGRQRWITDNIGLTQVLANGALFDSEVLTIGFARRFAEYKRPMLLFQDVERLKKIINNPWQPVQIVFAGKSHPADYGSKRLLQQVFSIAMNRDFQGRIAFIEDYDMHKARYMVQGVDVWLNNPRQLQEASGTSGMKAAINGVLHLSIPDGWWREGYNGANGWSIASDFGPPPAGVSEDVPDSNSLYRLLEDEVIPLYYRRDRNGVPHGWLRMAKESIRSIAPAFSARRMLREYVEKMYRSALQSVPSDVAKGD